MRPRTNEPGLLLVSLVGVAMAGTLAAQGRPARVPPAVIVTRQPVVTALTLTPIDTTRATLDITFARPEGLGASFGLLDWRAKLARRPGTANRFSGTVPFDFGTFVREQERRADLVRRGALTAVFEGRRIVRVERPAFLDPDILRRAIAARRPIRIPLPILTGIPITVDPARELMITDPGVVEDPTRTFDPCTGGGTPMGAWTFGKLMTDMANGQVDPAQLVEDWLRMWAGDQTVNGFTVPARPAIQPLVLNAWPRDGNGRLDLAKAPFRLLAIVNRIDLRKSTAYGGGNAGEGRFVFGVLNPGQCAQVPQFTVILEYGVPKKTCPEIHAWGQAWHDLGSIILGSGAFNDALQNITDQFAAANADPAKPNGSALNQLRSNEIALALPWELREFHLDATAHEFMEAPVAQTPDNSLNLTLRLKNYIDANQSAILAGTHQVPLTFQGAPFLGGASISGPPTFPWNSSPAANSNDARHLFSLSTCNACHGGETQTPFLHVHPRAAGSPAGLSLFLLGNGTLAVPNTISIPDPVTGSPDRTFGDLLRRQQDLDALLGSSCFAGGLLSELRHQLLNMVH